MDQAIFDPRKSEYKTPFGAAKSGETVTLSLRPARKLGCVRAQVTLRFEQDGDRLETLEMPWTQCVLGVDTFQVRFALPADYIGLVWYSFRLRYGRSTEESKEYQLTVYDGAEAVPEWFGEGMCYQIFPDRFCRLEKPKVTGPGKRRIHESWQERPEYLPDETGEITNRDFFGGSLKGVESKLDHLAALGVETIYFCPIFEALENHRYGTADYEKIDPLLGSEEDFTALCDAAHKKGIRIMLDGVFNHVGWASKYFNATGEYGPATGAAKDPHSPYHDWFLWKHWPDDYESWWGFKTLPAFDKQNEGYLNFLCGENGVVRSWLRKGADGWRLDVVDELPDEMVHRIHAAARAEKPDCPIIGEVWEDGSLKEAYGVRRKHIWGGHCDGLMNYPLRNALVEYLLCGNAEHFMDSMETLREHYPPFAFYNAMNALGTHDTLRILTLLGVGADHKWDWTRQARAEYNMSAEEYAKGLARLKLGYAVLFAFPGAPTVYYGDEAGMCGFEDPFNRQTYPWGFENKELVAYVSALGQLRKSRKALRKGDIRYLTCDGGLLMFSRTYEKETILAAVNNSPEGRSVTLPWKAKDLLTGEVLPKEAQLRAMGAYLLEKA